MCAYWLSTWFCVSGPSPCPESQHCGTWRLSAQDSDPPLPKGASPGWTPIQMWSGSLHHGIMMISFSLTFLFQHRSKEERHSLTVATPQLKQEGGAIPSRKSLPPPSPQTSPCNAGSHRGRRRPASCPKGQRGVGRTTGVGEEEEGGCLESPLLGWDAVFHAGVTWTPAFHFGEDPTTRLWGFNTVIMPGSWAVCGHHEAKHKWTRHLAAPGEGS